MKVLEIDTKALLSQLGYPQRMYYSSREVQNILADLRRFYPGRAHSDGFPTSTYYNWLATCSIAPANQLAFEELETLISLAVFLDQGGDVKSFRKLLIQKEKEIYAKQKRANDTARTISVTAQECP